MIVGVHHGIHRRVHHGEGHGLPVHTKHGVTRKTALHTGVHTGFTRVEIALELFLGLCPGFSTQFLICAHPYLCHLLLHLLGPFGPARRVVKRHKISLRAHLRANWDLLARPSRRCRPIVLHCSRRCRPAALGRGRTEDVDRDGLAAASAGCKLVRSYKTTRAGEFMSH